MDAQNNIADKIAELIRVTQDAQQTVVDAIARFVGHDESETAHPYLRELIAAAAHRATWSGIAEIPDTFPPSAHEHGYAPSEHLHNGSAIATGTVSYARLGMAQGDGYVKLPGGYILQWGEGFFDDVTTTVVALPIAFPNALLRAYATDDSSNTSSHSIAHYWQGSTLSTLAFVSSDIKTWGFSWLAIGA